MLKRRDYKRSGPDYRLGEQVSFADIKHTFGINQIRIGGWVEEVEKHKAANLIFDALADLACILQCPPHALGLRQTLNLAFGTGGQQGVQAHYIPAHRELALAKNAGAGALAHEFWHAFDHYIAPKAFHIKPGGAAFASSAWLSDSQLIEHPLNRRLSQVFATTLLSADGEDCHEFVTRAVALDRHFGRQYFSKPTELMARAFEACIESYSDISNPYLVNETLDSKLAHAGGYPSEGHRVEIFSRLIDYFAPLGAALNR
ncbi:CLCA_X family protein [Shewanella colwelliana]|uniref:CLCA_X family protein n=1 Tax=Shewanella colwelliana TaxID=23 RepID=UPI00048AEE61|nr:CLCA_X family protein [Shewanella colwelliana]MDX1282881.1 CLCA_X family protein [Shewanella colwelliana]